MQEDEDSWRERESWERVIINVVVSRVTDVRWMVNECVGGLRGRGTGGSRVYRDKYLYAAQVWNECALLGILC